MNCLRFEKDKKIEDKIINDVRHFQTKKIDDTTIKDIRNLFRLKKENGAIGDKIIRGIRNLFELQNEKQDYYKPVRVGKFRNNNYIEYESNGNRNKTLSSEEFFNKIRQCLKYIINNLKKSDEYKIHLTVTINYISSKGMRSV